MTPEHEALARRAVSCPRWRWMPGMFTIARGRIVRRDNDGYTLAYYRGGHAYVLEPDDLPDLTDPATLGCLLALVRESWGQTAYTMYYHSRWMSCGRWTLCADRDQEVDPGDDVTEAGALVCALEAAP